MDSFRKYLPCTFGAFFGRFSRLTEVQMRSIQPVLSGKDTLLCAPTASGKTEAYAAPLVERIMGGDRRGIKLLFVSPTRALANDLKRRLEVRMEEVGVAFGRYTGEHKERTAGKFPTVAVTTPEALDSLVARRPGILGNLTAVVLDEIHVLDGTPRGDQLRVLLHRLACGKDGRFQRVAASATIADPAGLAHRYLENSDIVTAGGGRSIRARAFDGMGVTDVARHVETLAKHGFRKVLIFCNARNEVELFSSELKGRTVFGRKVFPHHGSLARQVRERTERQFLDAPAALCVATLTLELGIDIGTVDYVLLLGVPPSVENLLQRSSRGSRRGDTIRVGYACRNEGERLLYRVLFSRGATGDFCVDPYAFRPGVLVQQALVCAGSENTVTAERLEACLPPDVRGEVPRDFAGRVLERMVQFDLLEACGGGRYVLSEAEDRKYDRGLLHGNIASPRDIKVVDRLTGDEVGGIASGRGTDMERLQIGGMGRRGVMEDGDRLLTDAAPGGVPARFTSRPLPGMTFRLARAVAAELGVGDGQVVQRRSGDGFSIVHGLGTAGSLLLRQCLIPVVGKARINRLTPITVHLLRPLEALPRPTDADLSILLTSRERGLASMAAMGPFHRFLPGDMRRRAVRAATYLDGVVRFLADAEFIREDDKPAPGVWDLL